MRQIVLDTETTGLDPATGDRVIEVAAIEIYNFMPTGQAFHVLVDPERDIPEEATKVHGFTAEMLRGKPLFRDIAQPMLDFIGDSEVIAHNARFDYGFLDAELVRAGHKKLDRTRMVDSLEIAKRRYPGLPNSLDALCRRLGVDNSMRTSHNALLDVKLLAEVYLELMGGKQPGFELAAATSKPALPGVVIAAPVARSPVLVQANEAEVAAHTEFVTKRLGKGDPLWLKPPFAEAPATEAQAKS